MSYSIDNSIRSIIVCGSNSKKSKSIEISGALSRALSIWALYFNPAENIPVLSNEVIQKENFPVAINFLLEKIREFQIIIFVFPQYNYNFSAFFKNVIDWCSLKSRNLFFKKRVILIGVSSSDIGTRDFKQVCLITFSSLGAEDVVFVNTTKNTPIEELVKQIRIYV